jgi:hypothetical protein
MFYDSETDASTSSGSFSDDSRSESGRSTPLGMGILPPNVGTRTNRLETSQEKVEKFIFGDSRLRRITPTANVYPTDYTINFSDPYKNVTSLSIEQFKIRNNFRRNLSGYSSFPFPALPDYVYISVNGFDNADIIPITSSPVDSRSSNVIYTKLTMDKLDKDPGVNKYADDYKKAHSDDIHCNTIYFKPPLGKLDKINIRILDEYGNVINGDSLPPWEETSDFNWREAEHHFSIKIEQTLPEVKTSSQFDRPEFTS